jgi:hypothetical protein
MADMPIAQQDVTFLLEGLMPSDRRDFHNPMRGFLSHAAKMLPELPSQGGMQSLVDYSRSVSPASQPAAWLNVLLAAWKNSPGKKPAGFDPGTLTEYMLSSLQASTSPSEKELQKCFAVGDYPGGRAPEVGATVTASKEEAEHAVASYQKEFSPSAGAVLALGGSADGQYLALAYHNEDITTSHVFQALKLAGYKLDEQAEAQLEAYDAAIDLNEPHHLMAVAGEVVRFLPFAGVGVPITDLHALHSQPHRYDQEVLDIFSNDVGIA